MHGSIRRYFLIFIGIVGMLSSGGFVITCLKQGAAPSPIVAAAIVGDAYQRTSQPSQFWFVLVLAIATFVGFAWITWRAYRS